MSPPSTSIVSRDPHNVVPSAHAGRVTCVPVAVVRTGPLGLGGGTGCSAGRFVPQGGGGPVVVGGSVCRQETVQLVPSLSLSLSVCLSVFLCLSLSLFFRLSFSLCLSLSLFVSLCVSVSLFLPLFLSLSVSPPPPFLSSQHTLSLSTFPLSCFGISQWTRRVYINT